MSATVDAEKISQYFGGCPTMHVPGRTFPVDTRYLEDAVELTKWSVNEGSQYARRSKPIIPYEETHLKLVYQLMTSSIAIRTGLSGRKKQRLLMKTIQNYHNRISNWRSVTRTRQPRPSIYSMNVRSHTS